MFAPKADEDLVTSISTANTEVPTAKSKRCRPALTGEEKAKNKAYRISLAANNAATSNLLAKRRKV